jgi:hypothetical protein
VRVQFPAGVKIASIPADVMPYDSAFAVDTTGRAWAWGDNALAGGAGHATGANAEGQVGDGKTAPAQHPVKVETGVSLISATADDVLVGAMSD